MDAADRGVSLLALTTPGQAAFDELMPMMMTKQAAMLAELDEEQRTTIERAFSVLEAAFGIACRDDQKVAE